MYLNFYSKRLEKRLFTKYGFSILRMRGNFLAEIGRELRFLMKTKTPSREWGMGVNEKQMLTLKTYLLERTNVLI